MYVYQTSSFPCPFEQVQIDVHKQQQNAKCGTAVRVCTYTAPLHSSMLLQQASSTHAYYSSRRRSLPGIPSINGARRCAQSGCCLARFSREVCQVRVHRMEPCERRFHSSATNTHSSAVKTRRASTCPSRYLALLRKQNLPHCRACPPPPRHPMRNFCDPHPRLLPMPRERITLIIWRHLNFML